MHSDQVGCQWSPSQFNFLRTTSTVVAVAGASPSPLTAADVRLPVFVVVGLAVLDAVREHRRLIADGESTEPHVDDSDEEDT